MKERLSAYWAVVPETFFRAVCARLVARATSAKRPTSSVSPSPPAPRAAAKATVSALMARTESRTWRAPRLNWSAIRLTMMLKDSLLAISREFKMILPRHYLVLGEAVPRSREGRASLSASGRACFDLMKASKALISVSVSSRASSPDSQSQGKG